VGVRRLLMDSELSSRLTLRGYTNAWPDLVGAYEVADVAADGLNEGARWQVAYEFGARWHLWQSLEPFVRLYCDLIDPPDDSAKTLWLARLQAGGAVPAGTWEWAPFAAVDVGHGNGLLVNRTELRASLGLRLYAR
jgi:hypothetical protein